MKTKELLITIFALCFSLGVISCDDDKNEKRDKILSVKDLSHTECKQNSDKGRIAESKEYVQLKASENYLAVFHVDATFNCCPVELLVNTSVEGNTIILDEKDKEQGCKCLCNYDLDYKVGMGLLIMGNIILY